MEDYNVKVSDEQVISIFLIIVSNTRWYRPFKVIY